MQTHLKLDTTLNMNSLILTTIDKKLMESM